MVRCFFLLLLFLSSGSISTQCFCISAIVISSTSLLLYLTRYNLFSWLIDSIFESYHNPVSTNFFLIVSPILNFDNSSGCKHTYLATGITVLLFCIVILLILFQCILFCFQIKSSNNCIINKTRIFFEFSFNFCSYWVIVLYLNLIHTSNSGIGHISLWYFLSIEWA